MTVVDVLVVGAGVAGSTAAIGLAREGLDVMLVDRAKLPRHKVCGCCLNRDALSILEGLGLSGPLEQTGAQPIEQVAIHSGPHSIAVESRGGVAVSRYALDAMLHRAAQSAGCAVQDQTTARVRPATNGSIKSVRVDYSIAGVSQQTIQARVVLVADGLAGSSMADARHAAREIKPGSLRGYGAHLAGGRHDLPAGEVLMHCGDGGYVGTVVLEDGSLDIAAAMKPGWVKSCHGPANAVNRIINESGATPPVLNDLAWKATAPLTGKRRTLWMPRVFFLGDSAGYVEPFTGEGMAWAMRSAQTLQPIVMRAVEGWDDRLGRDWQRTHRSAVQRRQWRCRLLSHALRRPRLTSSLVSLGSLLPQPAKQAAARTILPSLFTAERPPAARELATT
ncbi:MAG: NAD(P)/FAD-dependent oxidoreductase [Planctomycetota bacterium]